MRECEGQDMSPVEFSARQGCVRGMPRPYRYRRIIRIIRPMTEIVSNVLAHSM